jgi:hypothetical protein
MAHTITLSIPDEAYEWLQKTANGTGRTPEEVAGEWLAARLRRLSEDPLLKLVGAFEWPADLGERHDEYIGEGLKQKLSGADDA